MAWFNFGKKDSSSPLQDAPVETVETLRARAKRRLIGALVLVLAAVVGFPLLFDTQPRPLLTNVPIDIPDRSTVRPLPAPSSAPISAPSSVAAPAAMPVPVPVPVPVPAPAPARVDARTSLSQQEEIIPGSSKTDKNPANTASAGEKSTQTATKTVAIINPSTPSAADKAAAEKAAADKIAAEKATAKAKADKAASEKAAAEKQAAAAKAQADKAKNEAEASRARALLEGKPANPAASPERYIVQFGSFADNSKAREARLKVESAGFKTYVQVVETAQGKLIRVRVGPFATKAEADKAAAKIKALSLPAAILTL